MSIQVKVIASLFDPNAMPPFADRGDISSRIGQNFANPGQEGQVELIRMLQKLRDRAPPIPRVRRLTPVRAAGDQSVADANWGQSDVSGPVADSILRGGLLAAVLAMGLSPFGQTSMPLFSALHDRTGELAALPVPVRKALSNVERQSSQSSRPTSLVTMPFRAAYQPVGDAAAWLSPGGISASIPHHMPLAAPDPAPLFERVAGLHSPRLVGARRSQAQGASGFLERTLAPDRGGPDERVLRLPYRPVPAFAAIAKAPELAGLGVSGFPGAGQRMSLVQTARGMVGGWRGNNAVPPPFLLSGNGAEAGFSAARSPSAGLALPGIQRGAPRSAEGSVRNGTLRDDHASVTVQLNGDVVMDGRRLGRITEASQVRQASLPPAGQSRVSARSASLYSGTRIPQ